MGDRGRRPTGGRAARRRRSSRPSSVCSSMRFTVSRSGQLREPRSGFRLPSASRSTCATRSPSTPARRAGVAWEGEGGGRAADRRLRSGEPDDRGGRRAGCRSRCRRSRSTAGTASRSSAGSGRRPRRRRRRDRLAGPGPRCSSVPATIRPPSSSLAAEIEGHPGQRAPASLRRLHDRAARAVSSGGSTRTRRSARWRSCRRSRLRRTRLAPRSTRRFARSDAVFNAAHAALAPKPSPAIRRCSRVALADRLHEGARLALVPQAADVVEHLQRLHVPVCVSGAGPTLARVRAGRRPGPHARGPGVAGDGRSCAPGFGPAGSRSWTAETRLRSGRAAADPGRRGQAQARRRGRVGPATPRSRSRRRSSRTEFANTTPATRPSRSTKGPPLLPPRTRASSS